MGTPAQLPEVPQQPGGQPQAAAPTAPGTSLVGDQTNPNEQLTAQQRERDFMSQIRQLHEMVDVLAREFPETAKDMRQIKQLATQAMLNFVKTPASAPAQPMAPRLVG